MNPQLVHGGLSALLLSVSLQVFPANATLPGPAPEGAAPAMPGRLFYSSERREVLDKQRRTPQQASTVVEGETLTLNGIVTRSSGKWTVWINGNALDESNPAGFVATPSATNPALGGIRTQAEDRRAKPLAVGDSIERASSETRPLLGTGTVRVHSRAAPR